VVSAASAKYKTRIGAQRRPATAHRHIGADVPMCADACIYGPDLVANILSVTGFVTQGHAKLMQATHATSHAT